jgi:hypothetical protein
MTAEMFFLFCIFLLSIFSAVSLFLVVSLMHRISLKLDGALRFLEEDARRKRSL